MGRGPLAGPVVAAACILPIGANFRGARDSKELDETQRYALYKELQSRSDVDFATGLAESFEIDELNIHHATLLAMRRAVERLKKKPDFLLIDGCHSPTFAIPTECVVGGDGLVYAIAMASILAKVTRDHIMLGYHHLYPEYGFDSHKGYGTKKHLEAIEKFGPLPIHRKSFGKLKDYD